MRDRQGAAAPVVVGSTSMAGAAAAAAHPTLAPVEKRRYSGLRVAESDALFEAVDWASDVAAQSAPSVGSEQHDF